MLNSMFLLCKVVNVVIVELVIFEMLVDMGDIVYGWVIEIVNIIVDIVILIV